MNWNSVKTIFFRELKDQLRDRRTIIGIALLPLILYPLMGMAMLQVAQFSREQTSRIAVVGIDRNSLYRFDANRSIRTRCINLRSGIGMSLGRLSDFDLGNKRYPHWTKVREAQVAVAEADPNGAWVNTDDLNDGVNRRGKQIKNDLHYSAEGYKTLGKRFAAAAIKLIHSE